MKEVKEIDIYGGVVLWWLTPYSWNCIIRSREFWNYIYWYNSFIVINKFVDVDFCILYYLLIKHGEIV